MPDSVVTPSVVPAAVTPAVAVVAPVVAPVVTPAAVPPVVTPAVSAASVAVVPPAGTTVEHPEWMKAYSPESQEAILKNNWKTPDEVLKSYAELRKTVSEKGLQEPPATATKAEWDAYFEARGTPKLASEYTFALPKDAPPDMPYDAAFADQFKNWAKDAGLTKAQASALHDKYVGQTLAAVRAQVADMNTKVTSAHAELTKTWGAVDSESYRKNVELATRAIQNLDPDLSKAFKSAGLMTPDGTVMDASIAKALAKVGQRMYAEDQLYGAGQRVAEKNPWAKGSENLTKQGEIYKDDPARANALRQAAGYKGTI